MSPDGFREFLYKRPAIDLRIFAKEAGMSKSTIDNFIREKAKPTKRTLEKLEGIAAKYGYYWPKAVPKKDRKLR